MDKTKFLTAYAGLDSEGFKVEPQDHPLGHTIEQHMGRLCALPAGHPMNGKSTFDGEAGTYSDPKCALCNVTANPKGWDEIDGVKLPSVATWAEQGSLPPLTGWSDAALDAGLANWQRDGVRIAVERRKVQR